MDKKSRINPIPVRTEEIAKAILDSAYQVHTALGTGLLESVYEACLLHELKIRGINVVSSHPSGNL